MTDDYTHSSAESRLRAVESMLITASRITATLQQMPIREVLYESPASCKSLKISGRIGSGGRDRTADLGVMNPTLSDFIT